VECRGKDWNRVEVKGNGQIGYADKIFILGPCPNYKSDIPTRLGLGPTPELECPMSEPIVRMVEFVI